MGWVAGVAWHLYAVAEWPDEPPQAARTEALKGVGGSPVRLLMGGESIGVAASPLPAPLERPSAADLAAHAEVACWLVRTGATVLPFRFGMAAPDEGAVVALLHANRAVLDRELERLRGTAEAALAAFWEREGLRRELLRGREARRWLAYGRRGGADAVHLASVEIGRLVEQQLQAWRQRCGAAIVGALRPHALAIETREPIGVRMLLNFSLLIRREAEASLRAAVERLQEDLKGRVRLRLTVPLPPFSFAGLVLRAPPDEALKTA